MPMKPTPRVGSIREIVTAAKPKAAPKARPNNLGKFLHKKKAR